MTKLLAWSALMALAGCTVPATGIVRLGDGVMQAATVQQAEAFCRTDGSPTRLLDQPAAATGVLFRCD